MFCSDLQLKQQRPTVFCDLFALINVAFYFIYKDIPSTEYASKLMRDFPGRNLFRPEEFKVFRETHKRRFELDLCSKKNPFNVLASYLLDKRDYSELRDKKILKSLQGEGGSSSGSSGVRRATISYDHMISLIPNDLGRNAAGNKRRRS